MENIYKKLKYSVIVPVLIFLRKLIFSRKIKNTMELDIEKQLFFIQSSGRSGSTLLALLLNRHNKIGLPPEQYVLPYSIMTWQLTFKSWNSFCKSQLEKYFTLNQDWNWEIKDKEKLKSELNQLKIKHRSPANLFKIVLDYYLKKENNIAKFIGDHSPISTVFYKYIYSEFPNNKYIFLLRNPLDVVTSYSNMTDNPASNAKYAVWKWNNSIKAYEYLVEKNKQNVILIKYEDLVENPNDTLNEIFKFLGADYQDVINVKKEERQKDPFKAGNRKYHENLYKPITTNSIGRWKKYLDENIANEIIPLIKDNALKYGYYSQISSGKD